jgi:hypothetical protein
LLVAVMSGDFEITDAGLAQRLLFDCVTSCGRTLIMAVSLIFDG